MVLKAIRSRLLAPRLDTEASVDASRRQPPCAISIATPLGHASLHYHHRRVKNNNIRRSGPSRIRMPDDNSDRRVLLWPVSIYIFIIASWTVVTAVPLPAAFKFAWRKQQCKTEPYGDAEALLSLPYINIDARLFVR